MYKQFKEGDSVLFTIATEDQIKWGNNEDPRLHLELNKEYVVSKVEVHTWHTKVYLEGFDNLPFNSVHFRLVENL